MRRVVDNPLVRGHILRVAFVVAAVLRLRSYFGNTAEASDTRRRCPSGITIDVNHTSMSYLVMAPGVSSDGLSNPFRKRARATPSWMRHAAPAGST